MPNRKIPIRGRILPLAQMRRERAQNPQPPPPPHDRPMLRAHCRAGIRPCPFIACRHHLGIEAKQRSLRLPFATDADADEAEFLGRMTETCSLDVAERGDHQSLEIAAYVGMSRQGCDQVLTSALRKVRRALRDSRRKKS